MLCRRSRLLYSQGLPAGTVSAAQVCEANFCLRVRVKAQTLAVLDYRKPVATGSKTLFGRQGEG
jgi:hypothetical protein